MSFMRFHLTLNVHSSLGCWTELFGCCVDFGRQFISFICHLCRAALQSQELLHAMKSKQYIQRINVKNELATNTEFFFPKNWNNTVSDNTFCHRTSSDWSVENLFLTTHKIFLLSNKYQHKKCHAFLWGELAIQKLSACQSFCTYAFGGWV